MSQTTENNSLNPSHDALTAARVAPLLHQAFGFHQAGRFIQAKAFYKQVLNIQPDNFDALHLSGVLADQNGNHEEAVELIGQAIATLNQAGTINASHADAYYNLGNALQKICQYEEAVSSYQISLRLRPDNVDVYHSLGFAFNELGMHEAALASYQRAYELRPDYEYLFGFRLRAKLLLCDWTNIEQEFKELTHKIDQGVKNAPFTALTVIDDPARQRKVAENWVADHRLDSSLPPPLIPYPAHAKIRVGYFSSDFRNHPVGLLIRDLIETHDRGRFEIYGFVYGPETEQDPIALHINSLFDTLLDLRGLSNQQAAQLARDLKIDIAVDLNGHTAHNRTGIFALRAAPVQINYLGYPGASGADYMDYIIADRTVIPEADKIHYGEKVVYLPGCYQVNSRRPADFPPVSRAQYGLPEHAMVFCCFNNCYKFNPAVFRSWMRILKAVENSVLWLPAGNTARQNLLLAAAEQGIGGNRIIFAERAPELAEHLARQQLADLFLDTNPYNAHATAGDALWVGLPVLTRLGAAFAGRVAASLLLSLDLPELVAQNEAEYELKAMELATQPQQLADLKAKLRRKLTDAPLFDVRLFTAHLEAAYEAIHQRSLTGQEPADIQVPD